MHIAAAVGTPFVAIFGPTDPARHLVQGEKCRVFSKKSRCSPCYRPSCSRMRCMANIKPREVFEAVMEIIKVNAEPAHELMSS